LARTRDIGPLANHDEIRFRPNREHLVAAVIGPGRQIGHAARLDAFNLARNAGDPVRRRAAAAADDIDPAVTREPAHHFGGRVAADAPEAAETVRLASIGVADNRFARKLGQTLNRRTNQIYADTA